MKTIRSLIAFVVLIAFVTMMQVAAVPAGLAPTSSEVTVTGADEQAPGLIEQTSAKKVVKKKSALVPIIIGVVAVGAIAAVLVLFVFKGNDIRGTWQVTRFLEGSSTPFIFPITFTGEKKSGTFVAVQGGNNLTGTYTVDGKTVNFDFGAGSSTYTGTFTDKDNLSGTTVHTSGKTGTWTAVRTAEASVSQPAGSGEPDR